MSIDSYRARFAELWNSLSLHSRQRNCFWPVWPWFTMRCTDIAVI